MFPNSTSSDNSTVISNSSNEIDEYFYFDNSTPEATAISIARLHEGIVGFENPHTVNASLTSDGKYWIVKMNENDPFNWNVTIDAKTWSSIKYGGSTKNANIWRSLDELKSQYIADFQSFADSMVVGRPYKTTVNGKEIWKVHVHNEDSSWYIYVDPKTGKSKNTWKEFNDAAGTKDWLTIKEVNAVLNKMYNPNEIPGDFLVIKNLYPE